MYASCLKIAPCMHTQAGWNDGTRVSHFAWCPLTCFNEPFDVNFITLLHYVFTGTLYNLGYWVSFMMWTGGWRESCTISTHLGESITGIGDRRRREIKTYGWETYYEVLCCPEQTRQTSKISQFSFSEEQNGDAYSLDIATLLRLVPHTLHCNLETMFHLDQPPNKKSNCQRNVSIILNCFALVSRAKLCRPDESK